VGLREFSKYTHFAFKIYMSNPLDEKRGQEGGY
jgi:hypothetical protein